MAVSREFYTEPKKTFRPKKILWVIFIFAFGIFSFHFFLTGAKLSYESFKQLASLSEPKSPKTENSKPDFIIKDTSSEVLGIFTKKDSRDSVGSSWGVGLTMFRGNPTRTWYGTGEIPNNPEVKWRYPDEAMCAKSSDKGEVKEWCGSGWTGEPVIYEHDDLTEIIFGAYDKKVHFVNAETGKDLRTPFETGDIIKGSATLDPDGFPLLYFGSRDNKLRILSLEGAEAKEIWALDSKTLSGIWNDDWDGNPVILDDIMFEGGENGWFFAIKLNREFDADGHVKVAPEIIFKTPSYDKEFLARVGDNNVSIENSVAIFKDTAYFANSGGRVLGLDISHVEDGVAPVVFDYWVGDDVDASIVIDESGALYVAAEEERLNARSEEVGQLIKLDPKKKDPLVWSIKVPKKDTWSGGIWATPALYKNNLYVPTSPGELLVVDKNSGRVLFRDDIGPHAWSSPIISEGELLVSTCDGHLRKYSLENPDQPRLLTNYQIHGGSCIESTPALWNGNLYFGDRDGYFYNVGEK